MDASVSCKAQYVCPKTSWEAGTANVFNETENAKESLMLKDQRFCEQKCEMCYTQHNEMKFLPW